MERLAAILAKKACDKSFCEVEVNGKKRKRRSALSNDAESESALDPPRQSVKKSKQVPQGALDVIRSLNEQNLEIVPEYLEQNGPVAASNFGDECNTFEASSPADVIAQKDKEIEELRQQLVKEKAKRLRLQKTRYVDQTELQEFDNEFVIKECCLEKGSASFIKFESSVRGICSDARKLLKVLKNPN